MLNRYRLYQLAVGGCLAAVLFSSPVLGQQQAKENPPTVDKLEGTAVQAPTPKQSTGGDSASRDQAPAKTNPPPPAVENKGQAEESCGPRCQAAENRSKADLKAQERMAGATEEIVRISWFQFFAGLFGLGMLGLTLKYTRDTATAAVDAAKVTNRAFYAQHRPKLIVRWVASAVTDPLKETIVVHYTLVNVGDTPLWITGAYIGIDFVQSIGYPEMVLPIELRFPNKPPHIGQMAPGESVRCTFVDPQHRWDADHRKNLVGQFGVFFVGEISYLDAPDSGIRRQMGFRRKYDIHSQRFRRVEGSDDEYAD